MNFELTEEQQFIQQTVRDFAQKEIAPRSAHIDATGEFPHAIFRHMAELGLLGLPFPEEYGGAEADALSVALATEEIARGDGSTALAYLAHIGLGSTPLHLFGTEEQKRRFLTPAAQGEYIAAFGLTEPQAGSDAGATRTTARLEGDEWVINGEKLWITNAPIAGHIIVAALTDKEQGRKGISMIIVPRGTPGLSFGKHEHKMGLRGSMSTAVFLNDVRVPKENLLGQRGRGYSHFLQVLDGGRITIGAMAIGLAQTAYETAVKYAQQRETFGKPIGAYQSVSNMIADMVVGLEAARLLVYKAAWLKDQGQPFSHAAAVAKLYATEASEKICRDAIQVLGGNGYSSEYPVERLYRDTRLLTIGEGTSEIQRMVIARHVLGSFAAQL
ncbi:MAG: acyl-CoA dehydrogenase [Chloroflexi bacterium]|nr:MAG: acyl-CoA dehydrogenase [Chloroflexota bacterium]